jgi:outer membrane protein assembly factor BamD
MNKLSFYILLSLILLNACSKNENEISTIKESRQDLEMMTAYLEGYESLNKGDPYFAANKFLEAELLFPQSEWAPRSALMASYSYYQQNFYVKALSNLERFLITYPNSKDLVYAHYLIGMCYYETIVDEKRDSNSIVQAKNKFSFIVKNYPNTDFALDSQFKLNLIEDILASKEMYLGRHYLKKKNG